MTFYFYSRVKYNSGHTWFLLSNTSLQFMLSREISSNILSLFSSKSLTLSRKAFEFLEDVLKDKTLDDIILVIKYLTDEIIKISNNSIVNDDLLRNILQMSSKIVDIVKCADSIEVIDFNCIPKLAYDDKSDKFIDIQHKSLAQPFHIDELLSIYRNRYYLIKRLLISNNYFTDKSTVTSKSISIFNKLTSIESLLLLDNVSTNVFILAMITLPINGNFYAEDPTGRVKLNLKNALYMSNLIPFNSFVLLEGTYDDSIFNAIAVGLPPIMNPSCFTTEFHNIHPINNEATFPPWWLSTFSQISLDDDEVLEMFDKKLASLISKNTIPSIIIMCGPFVSISKRNQYFKNFEKGLSKLSSIILSKNELKTCHFIFVPSSNDFSLSSILPIQPFPESLTNKFSNLIKTSYFLSNPCRIRFRNKDIYIINDNLIEKICRFSVKKFSSNDNIPLELLKLFLGQINVLPLPYRARKFLWSHDHYFTLIPRPSIIICADSFSAFDVSENNCTLINPGNFEVEFDKGYEFSHLIS